MSKQVFQHWVAGVPRSLNSLRTRSRYLKIRRTKAFFAPDFGQMVPKSAISRLWSLRQRIWEAVGLVFRESGFFCDDSGEDGEWFLDEVSVREQAPVEIGELEGGEGREIDLRGKLGSGIRQDG